ncbi:MAG: DUF192 domain-containing protein [Betaproteobacteria bacterium]|nr:DUF192 domain-containing protein [Betaproteobacteria bacterium]
MMRTLLLTTIVCALALAGCAHSPAHHATMPRDGGGMQRQSRQDVIIRDLKNGEGIPPVLLPSLMWHLSNTSSPASAHEPACRPHSPAIAIVGPAGQDSASGLAERQQSARRRIMWGETALPRQAGAANTRKARPCVDVTLEAYPPHHWCLEVALTAPQLRRGLSGRTWLPHDGGMLFAHDHPQPLYYWMQNTYLPLDIIFLSPQGVVTRIYRNAQPMNKTPLDGGIAQYVIELPGGSATRDQVHVGSHFMFPPRRQLMAIIRTP